MSLVLIEVIWTSKLISAETSPVVGTVYLVFNNFFIWMWLLAALGYGRRWLSFNHPFLRYATEAVYPFYILHQTVIIIIGYHLAYANWSLWLKFPLVAAATFLICWAIFALGIRPWNPVRVLFGMKWQRSNREESSHGERTAGQGARRPVPFGGIGMAGVALCLLTLCSCARSGGELVCTEIEAPSLLGNQLGFPRGSVWWSICLRPTEMAISGFPSSISCRISTISSSATQAALTRDSGLKTLWMT